MKKNPSCNRRRLLVALGSVGLGTAATGLAAGGGRRPGPKPSEVLVDVSEATVRRVARHVPDVARIVHRNRSLGYLAVSFPSGTGDARERFVADAEGVAGVDYVEVNATHRLDAAVEATDAPVDDPAFASQHALRTIGAAEAWSSARGTDATVAVVDQGMQYDHVDLVANVDDAGRDFVESDADPYPADLGRVAHGTHVAGVVAATADNGEGVAGVSAATLLSARAIDDEGRGSTADIADAIQWAVDAGADVVNLSLSGGAYTRTMERAVAYATDHDVLVVAAVGNEADDDVAYPAAYDDVLAVAALDADESFAAYSNRGPKVDLCAPGTRIRSTVPDDEYGRMSGTSMAAAVVAGVAALAHDRWDLAGPDLRTHLQATAVDVGLADDEQGRGRVDAAAAVTTSPGADGSDDDADDAEPPEGPTTTRYEGSVSGFGDASSHVHEWTHDAPAAVEVSLDGPSNADFDLYVNEGRDETPSFLDHDFEAWSSDSAETISVEAPDDGVPLRVTVDAFFGDGEYTLEIVETPE